MAIPFVFLHSVTNPDSIELRMDGATAGRAGYGTPLLSSGGVSGTPRKSENRRRIFLPRAECSREWRPGRPRSLRVKDALRTNAEVVILEKDINDALRVRLARRGNVSSIFFRVGTGARKTGNGIRHHPGRNDGNPCRGGRRENQRWETPGSGSTVRTRRTLSGRISPDLTPARLADFPSASRWIL